MLELMLAVEVEVGVRAAAGICTSAQEEGGTR